MDENTRIRDEILLATLPNVAFDGWSDRVLAEGVRDAGFPADMAFRAFPNGIPDVIRHWSDYSDRLLAEEMAGLDLSGMRSRDRIVTAVRVRISAYAPYKESVRRTIAHLALPQNSGIAARNVGRTVDAIWYAAGDQSADFGYYTKRASLVPVYVATVLYWLDDESDDAEETWEFLTRRIDGIIRLMRMPSKLRAPFSSLGQSAHHLRQTAEMLVGRGSDLGRRSRPLR